MPGLRQNMPARLRGGLAIRSPRLTVRAQLTLLYAGFLLAAGIVVLAVPIFTIRSSQSIGATAHDLAVTNASVHAQVIRAAVTLAVLAAASLAIGWLIAGRFTRPLRTITATAQDISATSLSRRLDPGQRDNEFTELGRTLNDLFGRLEASFESQRRFVANASHELRTPLSAERALLQVALADPDATAQTLRATCQEVLALGEQQERLINALLTLATSQRGLERRELSDLAEITQRVLDGRLHDAARRGIKVNAELARAPAICDPNLAECLIANLVDNAIKHNRADGQVTVSTGPSTTGPATTGPGTAGALVSVTNTGPVIPADELDHLFEPFRQLGDERIRHNEGYGLGLAIVRAIADAHNASITARACLQGGLEIKVSFTGQQT